MMSFPSCKTIQLSYFSAAPTDGPQLMRHIPLHCQNKVMSLSCTSSYAGPGGNSYNIIVMRSQY